MYLLMERAQYGQIQDASGAKTGDLVGRKKEIYDIAVKKGKTIWPAHSNCSDVENAAKWIFYQVAEAMQFLHDEMQIVHRDLKHENILMGLKSPDPWCEDERQPTIKVCDFTTAFVLPSEDYRESINAGTLAFNAPELFSQPDCLPKPLDVWAFGVSLYVYLKNNLPVSLEGDFEQNLEKADFANIVQNLDGVSE